MSTLWVSAVRAQQRSLGPRQRTSTGTSMGSSSANTQGHRFVLTSSGSAPLAVTAYDAACTKQAVLLASATGVPQGYYRAFAQWLNAQGVSAYSFDYRGIARSRPSRLRGFEADFSHWAADIDTVLGHVLHRHEKVSLVGHSIGGFLAPLAQQATHASLCSLVLVGAQTAYWRDWPLPWRWPMAALWHGLMPAVTYGIGYFPGRRLRLGEDLPRGVALQWALRPWVDPFAHERAALYARALPPVHMVAASDDRFATASAQARVRTQLLNTEVMQHTVSPESLGRKALGHFGLFRHDAAAAWPLLLKYTQLNAVKEP
jgi:predicted alpha/beta hydrolase